MSYVLVDPKLILKNPMTTVIQEPKIILSDLIT